MLTLRTPVKQISDSVGGFFFTINSSTCFSPKRWKQFEGTFCSVCRGENMTKHLLYELMDKFSAPVAKIHKSPKKVHVVFTVSALFFHRRLPTLFAKRFPTKNYHRDSSTSWCFNSKLTVFFDADTPKLKKKKQTPKKSHQAKKRPTKLKKTKRKAATTSSS